MTSPLFISAAVAFQEFRPAVAMAQANLHNLSLWLDVNCRRFWKHVLSPRSALTCMTSFRARLKTAKARLFGTTTQDIVVPFELPCDCGHRVTGIRRASWQVARCAACDTSIYVLPVNVYPATKRIRSEVLDGSVASRLGTIVQELLVGAPDEKTRTASEKNAAAAPKQRHVAGESEADGDTSGVGEIPKRRIRRSEAQPKLSPAAAAIVADPILVEEPVVRVPRPGMKVIIRRIFTPFRLLMLSAIVLVVATGWWVVSQRRMDEARKTWRREMDIAERALDDKDLAALQASLTKAVAAAETLHRDDSESRRALGLLRQTLALENLSSVDLISLLSGNLSDDGTLSPARAAVAADSLVGKWFVIECTLRSSENQLRAEIPLIVDSVPVIIKIRSEGMQHAVIAMPQSPLLFVASVESCGLIENRREFQIQLRGDSWSLITTEFHAAEFGFTTANTPGLNELIQRQAAFLNSAASGSRYNLATGQLMSKGTEDKP